MMRNTTRLKSILARRDATLAPGAANALFARVIEDLGFEVVYVSGAGIANMHLGMPDIGLTTLSEIVDSVGAIADVVALPLLVDADTGFGNALNMFLYGTRAQVQPLTSLEMMLFATLATILGGIGRIWGAALAAVLLGVLQNSSILVIPSEWQGFLLYVVLFVTIIFFPQGIGMPGRIRRLAR